MARIGVHHRQNTQYYRLADWDCMTLVLDKLKQRKNIVFSL